MLRAKEAWLAVSINCRSSSAKQKKMRRELGGASTKLYQRAAQLQPATAITARACRVSLRPSRELRGWCWCCYCG